MPAVSSLFERDFLMRAVKQMVELLARALKLGTAKKDEAAALLESGALTLLGIEFRTLSLVDSSSAADLLGTAPRIFIFAKLLDGMRQVAEAANDVPEARTRAQHACEMVLELLKRYPKHEEAKVLLAQLVAHVDAELLPQRLQETLRLHRET